MIGDIPVYGPGTTNRFIPWFTATKAPYNYALPQFLGNHLTWNTWGGENQPVLFPMGHSELEYAFAQDYNNPNHIRQWNPMLLGYDLSSYNATNPMLVAQGNMNAYNMARNMVNNAFITQKIGNIARTLGALDTQLSHILNSDQLTDEQKSKIQALLDKIQTIKEEVQSQIQDGTISKESIEAIQGEILEFEKEMSNTINELVKEIEKKDGTGNVEKDTKNENNQPASQYSKQNISEEAEEKIESKLKQQLTESIDIVRDIYQGALGSWGTNYETIRKGTGKINKDNAATVVLAWEQQYKDITGKGLVETLFDEEFGWNPSLGKPGGNNKIDNSKAKNIDMIWNIVSNLEDKARELGVYNELAGAFTVAYDELDDTFVNEKSVIGAVDQIAKTVYEAQVGKTIEDTQKTVEKLSQKENKKLNVTA